MYEIHIFEIDAGKKKLYISCSTKNVQQDFDKFKKKVRKGKTPIILDSLMNKLPKYETAKEANIAARILLINLDRCGYNVIAGTPLQNRYWRVYVIELDNNPNKVYVGQSVYEPEKRLEQHKAGHNSALKVYKAKSRKLRPDIYGKIEKIYDNEEAKAKEAQLAKELKVKGFEVHGGH